MKFTFIVKQTDIQKAFEHIITDANQHTTIKGFRKGHAPRQAVINALGEAKLQQQAIEHALPSAFRDEVLKRQLKTVGYPKINLKKGTKETDWEFEAEVAISPNVDLNNYQDALKGLFAKDKIWTPGKDKNDSEEKLSPQALEDKKLASIFEKLLEICGLEVPQLLVEQEVNRMLSRLVDQTTKLGLKMDDYLTSTGQTQESLNKQYSKTATDSLKIEFILQTIATDLKIEVQQNEIEALISAVGDAKTKEKLTQPEELLNLKVLLVKRKTIEKLLTLAG